MENKTKGYLLFFLLLITLSIFPKIIRMTDSLYLKIFGYILLFAILYFSYRYIPKIAPYNRLFTYSNIDLKILFGLGIILVMLTIFVLLSSGFDSFKKVLILFFIGLFFIFVAVLRFKRPGGILLKVEE